MFWFIAGALLGAAVTLVALPLWRAARAHARPRRAYVLAGAFALVFAAAALLIYFAIGSHRTLEAHAATMPGPAGATGGMQAGGAPQSMDAAIAGLEARLARNGGSDADWNLLAQAYEFQGRAEDARRAREQHVAGRTAAPVTQMSVDSLIAAANSAGGAGSAPAATPSAAIAPPATLAELQQRVRSNPRDVEAWLALADLRRTQHDNAGAREALEKVIALRGMTAESWADYADVLASLNNGSLGGAAGRAIDNALAADPANPKALWLKASQAHEQAHYAEALTWWTKLLAALPPDSPDARIINGNIAEDRQLAGLPALTAAGSPAAPAAAAAAAAVSVSGTVSIDTDLATRVPQGSTLFIYAKAADSPGPPLAVMRTTAGGWPVSFQLDDSMAMLPSRRLSQFDKIVIEARISRSGQATPSSGDLYVTSPVLRPAEGKKLALVINRQIG